MDSNSVSEAGSIFVTDVDGVFVRAYMIEDLELCVQYSLVNRYYFG